MIRAWYRFSGGSDAQKNAITEVLVHVGIDVYALDSDMPSGPGMLFFEQITQQLCDFLQEVSRNGLERVLAVAVSDSVLPSEHAWRLLQAGASDVFAWNHSANPVGEVAAKLERWNTIDQLVRSPLVQNNLVGQGAIWISVLRQIVDAARFTNASILIMGETGTGKELGHYSACFVGE